jgi:alkanesulfonate monooxygenase SsuD/methylene tetrahydromethanopterin reductase-like flavin-dependent oxidoreductase (luciferase family)
LAGITCRPSPARRGASKPLSSPIHFGLKLAGQDCSAETLRAVWQIADRTGFDHVWTFDHLASVGSRGPELSVFESWALQAAMAETTRRVRIGCMVTGNTYRHPALLAKAAVTVDHLSNGRLEFGLGAAWSEVEHKMFGIEGLAHRVGMLDEALQVIKSLWSLDATDFSGRYYKLSAAVANPKPVQKPHPPIWIGASGPSTMALVARHADVWNVSGNITPGRVAELVQLFEEICRRVGRDPATVRRSIQLHWNGEDLNSLRDQSALYLEYGFLEQIIMFSLDQPFDARDIVESSRRLGAFLPDLRGA